MNLKEMIFGRANTEKKDNEEVKKELANEAVAENSELNPDQEFLAIKLEAIAEDYKGIDPEKAAENLAKNEEAQQKMKVAVGVLVTAGLLTAAAFALTESVGVTNVTELKPIMKEVLLVVSTVAAAISGALTQGNFEGLRSLIYKREKQEAEITEEDTDSRVQGVVA